jgi:hypothetical protein
MKKKIKYLQYCSYLYNNKNILIIFMHHLFITINNYRLKLFLQINYKNLVNQNFIKDVEKE